ncbi:MAG TPA: hypothetical protein VKD00_10625 [Methyloceanibacter sp.]|nr:hypothetical protein [Methyloceanibacter sp.]
MTLPISLPDPVTRSPVARLSDRGRSPAVYAKACPEAKAIFTTSVDVLGEGTVARRVRARSASARRS